VNDVARCPSAETPGSDDRTRGDASHPAHFDAATSAPAAPPHTETTKPTVVLVHGAWADGSSWAGVVRELQRDGFTVHVPANPLRGVQTDAAHLAGFLNTISGTIILVGHCYGGAVITNTADNPNVKALVYVNAFVPDQGETVLQIATQSGSILWDGDNPDEIFTAVPYPGGPPGDLELYINTQAEHPCPGFATCFAQDLPAQHAAVLAVTARPIALSALTEPSGAPRWRTIPSWAVVGSIDRIIPAPAQIAMAKRANAHITQIQASHLSMLSDPEAVTDIIIAAAHATT
jgi:pimeloyl-ACP methyl ester carboxylesterase